MKLTLINNRFKRKAQIALSEDLLRGYGVFETILTEEKIPLHLEAHLNRLFQSAKKIKLIPRYSKEQVKAQIYKISQTSRYKTQRIRITLLENTLIITSQRYKISKINTEKGVKVMSVRQKRALPEIKSISYLPSYLAHKLAEEKDYFDALLIDEKEEVYECAYANLFWFEGNTLCTREKDVLPGIIRQIILKKSPFSIKFKNIKLSQLLKKKEIFLSSSIQKILPITQINKTKIGNGKPGPNTEKLREHIK